MASVRQNEVDGRFVPCHAQPREMAEGISVNPRLGPRRIHGGVGHAPSGPAGERRASVAIHSGK